MDTITRTVIPVNETLHLAAYPHEQFVAIRTAEQRGPAEDQSMVIVFFHEVPSLISALATAVGETITGAEMEDARALDWITERLLDQYETMTDLERLVDTLKRENNSLRDGVDPTETEA